MPKENTGSSTATSETRGQFDSDTISGETKPSKHRFESSEQIRRTSLQVRLSEVQALHVDFRKI